MTYDHAQAKLEQMAIAGSTELIPVSQALPLLGSQQIYRMIRAQKLPAVKIGVFLTSQAIASEFFRKAIRPTTKTKEPVVLEPDRVAQIEDAKRRVMQATRERG